MQGARHVPEEVGGCFLIQSVPWGSGRPRPAVLVGRPGQETGIWDLGFGREAESEVGVTGAHGSGREGRTPQALGGLVPGSVQLRSGWGSVRFQAGGTQSSPG